MTEIKLKVNMHCAACATNIDRELNKGGADSQSNPTLKITKVKFDESKTSSEEIIKKIAGIGYEAIVVG